MPRLLGKVMVPWEFFERLGVYSRVHSVGLSVPLSTQKLYSLSSLDGVRIQIS